MEPRNPHSAVFFCFFLSKPNLLYLESKKISNEPTFGMVGANDRFFQKFVFVTFIMWTKNKLHTRHKLWTEICEIRQIFK